MPEFRHSFLGRWRILELEARFARQVLGDVVGPENVLELEPTMGAEDFAFYLLEKPGCFFAIGAGDRSRREKGHGSGPFVLHGPSHDFNDELIPIGASVWVRVVESWLSESRPPSPSTSGPG